MLIKYPNLEGSFFILSWAKQINENISVNFSNPTKESINVQSDKNVTFVFKLYFFGSKQANPDYQFKKIPMSGLLGLWDNQLEGRSVNPIEIRGVDFDGTQL